MSPSSASVEEAITVTGTGFNSLGTVTVLTIGSASALPSPAPRATRSGGLEFDVTVPLLNPGTYTVTMTNATGFSASTTFVAVAATVVAASTADDTATIFADVIANDDNLVRVWRFSNPDQSWSFYDPRPAFAEANTLAKTGAGDIVWVNVTAEQTVADLTDTQNGVLSAGWNLISLK
ncbi:MAG: IPT/TIG domain-containing protein [Chloroflexota bacterium]|nr:IPT/TIG domain-containing protein [Chloroflexota bacterium]